MLAPTLSRAPAASRVISFAPLALLALSLLFAGSVNAASRTEIDARVEQGLSELYQVSSAARELTERASGVLVIPKIVKGGFILGAEYGEGALVMGGEIVDYYNQTSGSIGIQIGVQSKSLVILFMNDEVLNKFRSGRGWKVGVDGGVALASLGAGGAIDSQTAKEPIIGFVFGNKGFMVNLNIEGTKITRIKK